MTAEFAVWKRLCLAAWMAVAAPLLGQDAAAGAKPLVYDAVSIKPNSPDGSGMMMVGVRTSGDSYTATGVSVKGLIQYAYGLKMEDQILGVMGPLGDARFDITAKMDAEAVAALKKLSNDESNAQRKLMMQAMLADRFKLKVHHESRELPMYSLVVAKSGFKSKAADPNDTYPNGVKGPDGVGRAGMMRIMNGTMTAQGIPMSELANNLTFQVHRQVVDRTGLTGKYDINLKWTPDDGHGEDAASAESGPSIFTAVQEQLGLKLEPTKGAVDTIVVDHVEMPSEN